MEFGMCDIYTKQPSSRLSIRAFMRMTVLWCVRDNKSRWKMCNRGGTLSTLALFLLLFCDSTSSECMQQEPCVCFLPDGSYYNLTSLANKETLFVNHTNLEAYFHPCKDVPISINDDSNIKNECASKSGVSLCMHNITKKTITSLGTVNETHMKLSMDHNKNPIFEIHHNNITSIIDILCATENSYTHFVMDHISQDTGKYHFLLVSQYGCKKEPYRGLSTGSILVILFFTFTGLYFIGGAIILKTMRGATGWEMLPNHDFWCELPSLVKDGIVFTFSCCPANSYERI